MESTSTPKPAASATQDEASIPRDPSSTLPQRLDSLAMADHANTPQTTSTASQEAVSKVEISHDAEKAAPEVKVAPQNARQAYDQFLDRAVGTLPDVDTFGDLDNDVHPLFLRENIYQQIADPDDKFLREPISQAVYTSILPAFRLASLLITERSMCPVFDHIANGIVTRDAEGNSCIAKGFLEGTKLGYDYVQAVFKYLTSHTHFIFLSNSEISGGTGLASSSHRFDQVNTKSQQASSFGRALHPFQVPNHDGHPLLRHVCMGHTQVRIRRYFLEYFENDMQQDTRRGQINALFYFTLLLMHEMTHTFAFYVENAALRVSRALEPRWSFDVPLQEFSFVWEAWFTHGLLISDVAELGTAKVKQKAILFPMDVLVLTSRHMPLEKPNSTCVIFFKPPHYLQAMTIRLWFRKSTWQAARRGIDVQSDIWNQVKACKLGKPKDSAFLHALVKEKSVAKIAWEPRSPFMREWFYRWLTSSALELYLSETWSLDSFPYAQMRFSQT